MYKTVQRIELRTVREAVEPYGTVRSSSDVTRLLQELFGLRATETFGVMHLDSKGRVLGYEVVGYGNITLCPVLLSEVFRGALVSGAAAIIVAHNHPSGSTTPSKEDFAITTRILEASHLLKVKLLDHVIVSPTETFSFLDEGLLE